MTVAFSDYEAWELLQSNVNFYGNLTQPLTVALDFTDISWDSVSFEIGFKITPLLDRVRNFEKTNEFITFTPQNFTLKTVVPQSFRANFLHYNLSTSTVTIANIKSDGLIDANGLEYNIAIPDKNDAIAIFRVTQKTATQAALNFTLNVKFQYLKIRVFVLVGTITLKLKTDYLFYYTDGTHEDVNQLYDSCSVENTTPNATSFTETELQNVGTFLKNGDLSTLPSNPAKTLADVFLVTYLEVDATVPYLKNATRIQCYHIFINHNYIQIDEMEGNLMPDY